MRVMKRQELRAEWDMMIKYFGLDVYMCRATCLGRNPTVSAAHRPKTRPCRPRTGSIHHGFGSSQGLGLP